MQKQRLNLLLMPGTCKAGHKAFPLLELLHNSQLLLSF
jgi:hypothetical protein